MELNAPEKTLTLCLVLLQPGNLTFCYVSIEETNVCCLTRKKAENVIQLYASDSNDLKKVLLKNTFALIPPLPLHFSSRLFR